MYVAIELYFWRRMLVAEKGKHIFGNRDSLTYQARALCLRHEIKDFFFFFFLDFFFFNL